MVIYAYIYMMNKITSFDEMIDQYSKSVFRYIYTHVHHYELTEDLTQQTFFKVWENRSLLDPKKSPLSYLYKIALNEIRMYYRDTKYLPSLPDGLEIVDPRSISNIDVEKTGLLLKELSKLPDQERELIILRYIHQMGTKEVSAIIERNIVTTRVILHRALKKLKMRIIETQSGDNQ